MPLGKAFSLIFTHFAGGSGGNSRRNPICLSARIIETAVLCAIICNNTNYILESSTLEKDQKISDQGSKNRSGSLAREGGAVAGQIPRIQIKPFSIECIQFDPTRRSRTRPPEA